VRQKSKFLDTRAGSQQGARQENKKLQLTPKKGVEELALRNRAILKGRRGREIRVFCWNPQKSPKKNLQQRLKNLVGVEAVGLGSGSNVHSKVEGNKTTATWQHNGGGIRVGSTRKGPAAAGISGPRVKFALTLSATLSEVAAARYTGAMGRIVLVVMNLRG